MTRKAFEAKAEEVIEMIGHFRDAQGWMDDKDYFEYEMMKRLQELMYPWFD